MKHIIAYIKPHKLSKLTLALQKVEGLTGMSALDIRGLGRGRDKDDPHRTEEDLMDYVPHVKFEIFCKDELLEEIVSIIQTVAHTGLRGDGKIYICGVSDAIRISTGERGEAAV
ncbi:MAG: P-II family nitrogen regulator [Ignavibacteriae bacterium]|nr:MAG: P-II family nitrogen regulator [Ignavibacteriota bacterium]